jgi:hypothetical protein
LSRALTPSFSRPEQRGTLALSRRDSWLPKLSDAAHWNLTDNGAANSLTIPYFLDFATLGSLNSRNDSITWLILDDGSVNLNPYAKTSPDPEIASIFSTSLNITNGSAATALSTIITVLSSMAYYDQMPYFREKAEDVALVYFESLLFPHSFRRFTAVLVMLTMHCLLVLLITIAFVKSTRWTIFGDHWQTISQVVTPATECFLAQSSCATDKEVKVYLVAELREREAVNIRPLDGEVGRVGLVARKVRRESTHVELS